MLINPLVALSIALKRSGGTFQCGMPWNRRMNRSVSRVRFYAYHV
jgi:hypothetical protein